MSNVQLLNSKWHYTDLSEDERRDLVDKKLKKLKKGYFKLTEYSKAEYEKLLIKKPNRLCLSYRQKEELQALIHAETTSQNIRTRAKIILGLSSDQCGLVFKKEFGIAFKAIRLWRSRWITSQDDLALVEETDTTESLKKALLKLLIQIEVGDRAFS